MLIATINNTSMLLISTTSLICIKAFSDVFLTSASVLFLAILFLQSGIDKVADRSGNLSWLMSHFSNSPLRNMVPLLLFIITIVELLAGLASFLGVFWIIIFDDSFFALLGVILSMASLLMLFFGQRIAKDYTGAQSLVSYFVLAMITLMLLLEKF